MVLSFPMVEILGATASGRYLQPDLSGPMRPANANSSFPVHSRLARREWDGQMPAHPHDGLPRAGEGKLRRPQPALFVLFIFLKQGDQALGEHRLDWIMTRTPSGERG